jgi:hypothetical protein
LVKAKHFLKTLDDRFILKSLSPIETQAFLKFAPAYFQIMSEPIELCSCDWVLDDDLVKAKHLGNCGREFMKQGFGQVARQNRYS